MDNVWRDAALGVLARVENAGGPAAKWAGEVKATMLDEKTLDRCKTCRRQVSAGAVCRYCTNYCDYTLVGKGQGLCDCECHQDARVITGLPRKSNFDKTIRFLVVAGPRKGEIITFRRGSMLSLEAARHAALAFATTPSSSRRACGWDMAGGPDRTVYFEPTCEGSWSDPLEIHPCTDKPTRRIGRSYWCAAHDADNAITPRPN